MTSSKNISSNKAKIKQNTAIRCRIYPDKEQASLLCQTFGCVRFIWNRILKDIYNGKKGLLTPAKYKDEFPFLKKVDSLALANTNMDLMQAFRNHKNKPKQFHLPRFKRKKTARRSYRTNNQNGTVAVIDDKHIRLPKVGVIKAKVHRAIEEDWSLKSATVFQDAAGHFFVSLLFEYYIDKPLPAPITLDHSLGLDYKSDALYVDSNGNSASMPRFRKSEERRLAREQRKLSRKKYKSRNYAKQRRKVGRLQVRVANRRRDFLHKLGTAIAKQYDVVCVEDLNLRNVGRRNKKGPKLGKATHENGFGEFRLMLEYKLHRLGKHFIKVDKFYPSTQLCSVCGHKEKELKGINNLGKRDWTCPNCGTHHDRDVNAAKNIRNEGVRALLNVA